MAYQLITNRDSRNFTPAASVPATFGRPRTIESITIHWWGLPEWGDTFEGVTEFLCTNTKPTSAHEVIEAGRVAVIVNHGDASWAAGNAVGNATSIHLECRPRASEADYATVAERVRDLRAMYGDLPLVPHREWQSTQCPGHWDLAKIDRLARSMAGGASILPTGTTTSKEGFLMALSDKQQQEIYDRILGGIPAGASRPIRKGDPATRVADSGDIAELIRATQAQHDVTRAHVIKSVTGATQAQEDVTRKFLSDRITEGAKPSEVADSVIAALGTELAKQVATELGNRLAEGTK